MSLCHRTGTKLDQRNVSESGFSLVELLVTISLIVILTSVTILTLGSHRSAYRSEDASAQFVNFLRQAQSRALAERQSMRLVINRTTNRISLIDENTIGGGGNNENDTVSGDDSMIRSEGLMDTNEVRTDRPSGGGGTPISSPPAPYAYAPAVFSSNLWVAHFESDGSVTALSGGSRVPVSATFFFWPPTDGTSLVPKVLTQVRAVTVFGPSGSVRHWKYDGMNFVAETV